MSLQRSVVKQLGHWHFSNCGLWVPLLRLWQGSPFSQQCPVFSCETGVFMIFLVAWFTSLLRIKCVYGVGWWVAMVTVLGCGCLNSHFTASLLCRTEPGAQTLYFLPLLSSRAQREDPSLSLKVRQLWSSSVGVVGRFQRVVPSQGNYTFISFNLAQARIIWRWEVAENSCRFKDLWSRKLSYSFIFIPFYLSPHLSLFNPSCICEINVL